MAISIHYIKKWLLMLSDKSILHITATCVAVVKDIVLEEENGYYCEIENSDATAECMIKAAQLRDINNDYDLFNKEALLNCFK